MRKNNKVLMVMSVLAIASIILAACGAPPTPETIVVTQIVQGESQTVVVTATPEPEPVEPKVMVVCMAQEPQTLYTYSESALVKSAVLEAVYDFGVDTRSYQYQNVGIAELPSFDNGLAAQEEVTVAEGAMVYDAGTDAVVPLAAGVVLNQLDGSQVTYESGEAKAVQLTVTWALVDGINWEDGTPVTTDDILFA
ncbi:MAG: hypothetical protein AAB658_16065, partial [Chloroflexota bacterium]